MNANELTKRLGSQAELFLRRNGPTILTAAGVGGFIVANVLTAKATRKAEEPIKELKLQLDRTKEHLKSDDISKSSKKQMRVELGRDFVNVAKIYVPAVSVGTVSIVCVVAAHGLMQKRQASLIAAYAALDRGFKAYRARVAEELGVSKERELYRMPELLPCEDGETAEINYSADMPSPYSKVFDQMNPNWTNNPEYNLFFLTCQQNWANDRLKVKGFLFLNEVYEALGMRWTQAGQVVGWKLNNGHDNFVDFGIFNIGDEISRSFVNGTEDSIWLDFNVDGLINI